MGSPYQKIKKEMCYRNARSNQGTQYQPHRLHMLRSSVHARKKIRTRSEIFPYLFGKSGRIIPQIELRLYPAEKFYQTRMVIIGFYTRKT